VAGGGLNQAAGDAAALYRMAGNVGCLISDRVILLTPGADRQWLRSRRRSRSILNMDIERHVRATPHHLEWVLCSVLPVLYFAATSLVCA